jgi:hypothetical protein
MVRRPASNDEREEKAAQVEQRSADQKREYRRPCGSTNALTRTTHDKIASKMDDAR